VLTHLALKCYDIDNTLRGRFEEVDENNNRCTQARRHGEHSGTVLNIQ